MGSESLNIQMTLREDWGGCTRIIFLLCYRGIEGVVEEDLSGLRKCG